jgi:hypothetical protein
MQDFDYMIADAVSSASFLDDPLAANSCTTDLLQEAGSPNGTELVAFLHMRAFTARPAPKPYTVREGKPREPFRRMTTSGGRWIGCPGPACMPQARAG